MPTYLLLIVPQDLLFKLIDFSYFSLLIEKYELKVNLKT